MTPISTTRPQLKTHGNRKFSKRIAGGELTTLIYRQFCADQAVPDAEGVFYPGHPPPFAYRKPMICRNCGWIAEMDWLDDNPDAAVLTLQAVGGDLQRAEPAEYAQVCVECGAKDSFETAPLCAVCDEYPCVCDDDHTAPMSSPRRR